ncbi:hypothetical protein V9K97_10465 [Variovorax sp. CCNWLW186]|uniref:hypothetical protein n=1 Tax=Variovorax sp. CCNWLW186 TaxID=3127473 RepID=UPI003076A82B
MNHSHQIVGQSAGDSTALHQYLERELQSGGYDAIAEELNEAAILRWNCSESTARRVATSLGIRHRFCDPEPSERAILGIPSREELEQQFGLGKIINSAATRQLDAAQKNYWPIREAFWLARLQELGATRILFILGADHIQSFSAFLTREGISFICLEQNWEP